MSPASLDWRLMSENIQVDISLVTVTLGDLSYS